MTIVGIFPPPEIRTGGHKRYRELTGALGDRGHTIYQVCRPSMAANLPGTPIPIIPDSITSFLPPRWWQYRRAVRVARRTLFAAVAPGPVDAVLAFGETNYAAARATARIINAPLLFAIRSNFVDEFLQFGGFRRRLSGSAVLAGLGSLERRIAGWWKRRLEKEITRNCDVVVFQSSYDRDNVAERCPWVQDKARVIPNSMRLSWLPAASANTNSSTSLKRAIYLGNLGERKGVQYLFPALRDVGHHLHVDVIGFGGLEQWARDYVNEHGMDGWVTFHGRVDQPLQALAAADLLVVPSLYDSFPNTVLEALFVGTPVIGSDSAGIKTMLVHDELLFPRADSAALGRRLRQLVTDDAAYRRVRDLCAERRPAFDFDWAARWETELHGMVERHAATGQRS